MFFRGKVKPIAFHFNCHTESWYKNEIERMRRKRVRCRNVQNHGSFTDSDCHVLTFDNRSNSGMLFDSAKELGVEVRNIGTPAAFRRLKEKYPPGEKWKSISEGTSKRLNLKDGFLLMHKLFAIYDFLKAHQDVPYFYFFDQSDVVLVDYPQDRIETFLSHDCDLLFNAETKFMYWPYAMEEDPCFELLKGQLMESDDVKKFEREKYRDAYRSKGQILCHLNSGCMVGKSDYYVAFFEKHFDFMREFIHLNDQTVMHHFHSILYPELKIDSKCEVFQCLGPRRIKPIL